jgi:Uri superfamily endonuclease
MVPDCPGTYALVLNLPCSAADVSVGRLGHFRFLAGWYVYAGSARGPGGLAARLARHLRTSKSLHWHVDYLRAQACPIEIWYTTGTRKRECAWTRALLALPGARIPVPRFGASDCRCVAHLVYFAAPPGVAAFADVLGERVLREALSV